MRGTAEEIARIAGCSPATVSRVLNNSGPVSGKARGAVLKAIREAGVIPQRRRRMAPVRVNRPAAVASPSSITGLVEIVMYLSTPMEPVEVRDGEVTLGPIAPCPPHRFFRPENRYSNSHYRRIIDGAIDEMGRWPLRPVLRTTDRLDDPQLLADVNDATMRGLIVLGNDDPHVQPFLRRCQAPVISFVGHQHKGWPPLVDSYDLPGMRQAVGHLVELGHTRIAYVAGSQRVPNFRERLAAFKVAMAEADLAVHEPWIFKDSLHIAEIAAGVERILSRDERPTAIICCYDGAAIGVRQTARRLGLTIPDDLSVVGFGDQEIVELFEPALTTVHVPTYEMGRAAVRLLVMQQLAQDHSSQGLAVRLPTSLVVRDSTAAPRTK